MEIITAKTAGFCFGVDRAVNLVYKVIDEGKKVATLGPIIHNPQLVSELCEKGVRIIENPSEAAACETVVIRSHGVTPETIDELKKQGAKLSMQPAPMLPRYTKLYPNIHKTATR